MENIIFSDIFDMESLQKLMDSLSAALKISLSVRSPLGEPFIRGSYPGSLQEELREKSLDGHRIYEEFLASLCPCKASAACVRYCQPTGMAGAAIPIIHKNVHVISLLAEGVRLASNDPDEETCRRIAASLGMNEEAYLKSIRRLPLTTEAELNADLSLLSMLLERSFTLRQENRQLKSMVNSLESQETLHRQEKDALEQLAEIDSMTGLYNRRKFEEVVSLYAGQKDRKICMISGDANFLKLTNDIFGHDAGDLLLKTIAKIMNDLAKDNWLVARCGGDEFRVILPDTTLETALDYCRRVARDCSHDKSLTIPLSVALGAAEWNSDSESLQGCFSRADIKMYQNKTVLKHEQRVPHYIMERLYDRQILNRNVVEFSAQVASEFALYLGFSEDHAREIGMAAQYQDIGMAKLPESIVILGQSRTEEELMLIRMHVTYSYSMARQFDELYKIADIIHCSHENWAGGSYPNGLQGEQIPMEARVIHLVSDYSDWTHPASIERYCTREEAAQRLAEDGGRVYDPKLALKFLDFLAENHY